MNEDEVKKLLESIKQKKEEQAEQAERLNESQQILKGIDLAIQQLIRHAPSLSHSLFFGVGNPRDTELPYHGRGIDKGLEDHKRWLESASSQPRTYTEAEMLAELGVKE